MCLHAVQEVGREGGRPQDATIGIQRDSEQDSEPRALGRLAITILLDSLARGVLRLACTIYALVPLHAVREPQVPHRAFSVGEFQICLALLAHFRKLSFMTLLARREASGRSAARSRADRLRSRALPQ